MVVGFIGSQGALTSFQKENLPKVLELTQCTEFVFGDTIGSDQEAIDIAFAFGVRIFTIFPCDKPDKRGFRLDPQKLTAHLDRPTPWIEVAEYKVRYYPVQPFQKSKEAIIDNCAYLIAAPKEHRHNLKSATWRAIRHAWKIKRDITIIPPIERNQDSSNE